MIFRMCIPAFSTERLFSSFSFGAPSRSIVISAVRKTQSTNVENRFELSHASTTKSLTFGSSFAHIARLHCLVFALLSTPYLLYL